MLTSLRKELAACLELLLPEACLFCGRLLAMSPGPRSFCHPCLSCMPPLSVAQCSCCAQPLPSATTKHLCGHCLQHPPAFVKVHAAGLYQRHLKEAVHRLKYRNQVALARPLGRLLTEKIIVSEKVFVPDLIVPVPLHPSRLRQRGFNQALEVARPISRTLNVPLDSRLLERSRETRQQQGLSAKERKGNLRKAFSLSRQTPARRILLIDDVMTTGETVRECSRTLVSGGITEVQVAVVARA